MPSYAGRERGLDWGSLDWGLRLSLKLYLSATPRHDRLIPITQTPSPPPPPARAPGGGFNLYRRKVGNRHATALARSPPRLVRAEPQRTPAQGTHKRTAIGGRGGDARANPPSRQSVSQSGIMVGMIWLANRPTDRRPTDQQILRSPSSRRNVVRPKESALR